MTRTMTTIMINLNLKLDPLEGVPLLVARVFSYTKPRAPPH